MSIGDRQCPGDLLLRTAHPGRVLKLAGGVLKAQAEQVPARCLYVLDELTLVQITQIIQLYD